MSAQWVTGCVGEFCGFGGFMTGRAPAPLSGAAIFSAWLGPCPLRGCGAGEWPHLAPSQPPPAAGWDWGRILSLRCVCEAPLRALYPAAVCRCWQPARGRRHWCSDWISLQVCVTRSASRPAHCGPPPSPGEARRRRLPTALQACQIKQAVPVIMRPTPWPQIMIAVTPLFV